MVKPGKVDQLLKPSIGKKVDEFFDFDFVCVGEQLAFHPAAVIKGGWRDAPTRPDDTLGPEEVEITDGLRNDSRRQPLKNKPFTR